MRRVTTSARIIALAGVTTAAASCEQLIGLDQFHDIVCVAGDRQEPNDCPYPGPAGTKGVGICRAGEHLCAEDQQSWTACTDPVLPAAEEDCATPEDDNCNGVANEASAGCCAPGTMVACYSGKTNTEGIGLCKGGTQACSSESGKPEGACVGEVLPAHETCANHEDENCDSFDCVEWASIFGDGADQAVGALVTDATGNIVVVGQLFGSMPLTPNQALQESGGGDVFVLKLDSLGNVLWGKTFGSDQRESGTTVAIDSKGDIIIGGWTTGTFALGGSAISPGLFVAKLSGADGSPIWSRPLGGACPKPEEAYVNPIYVTKQNELVLGGAFCASLDLGGSAPTPPSSWGRPEGYVTRLHSDGSPGGWSFNQYGGVILGDSTKPGSSSQVAGIALAPDDRVLVTGSFEGGILLGTGLGVGSAGGTDIFVLELHSDGSPSRITAYGGPSTDAAVGLRVTPTGDYVLAGSFTGDIDLGGGPLLGASGVQNIFLAKFALSPTFIYKHEWSAIFGGTTVGSRAVSLDIDPMNNLVLAGTFFGQLVVGAETFDSGSGFGSFVAKADSAGKGLWARAFYGDITSTPRGATAVAPSGEVVFAGVAPAPVNFGTGTLTPQGTDAFIAKFGL